MKRSPELSDLPSPDSSLAVIVPMKPLTLAKQRLRPVLPDAARRDLAYNMLNHVLATVTESGVAAMSLLISADRQVLRLANEWGFAFVLENVSGYNESAAQGVNWAQQAGMDLETITDMYFDSVLLDYPKVSSKWDAWAKKMEGAEQVHILGKKTDLKLSVKGLVWGADHAKANIPGGEIATGVVNEALDGHIYFENPAVLGGKLMYDTYLEWKNGKLVKATSRTNEDYLHKIIATDAGSSLLGEVAFGTNPGITSFSNDILWDEKIYGTIHIALGRSYAMHKAHNYSAIHWDIVKDMRQEGEVIVDGVTVLKDGELLLGEI